MDTNNAPAKTVPETASEIKRTSLNLQVELWDELRIAAIRRGMTFGAAVEAALRFWIDSKA